MAPKRFVLNILMALIGVSAFAQQRMGLMQKSDSIHSLFESRFIVLDSLIFGVDNPRNGVSSDLFIQASR